MKKLDDELAERAAMIVKDYRGIYPPYEAFYIQSVAYAAERAECAFDGFDIAVAESAPPEGVMGLIQEALIHAAALSRFFWPMRKPGDLATARGLRLREAFNVQDDSPLQHRRLRNAFEHFDEDLDRFLLDGPVGYCFPSPIVDDHALADDEVGNIFKLVDPVNGICVLLGQKYDFRAIRDEVRRVLAMADEMDGNGSRLPRQK